MRFHNFCFIAACTVFSSMAFASTTQTLLAYQKDQGYGQNKGGYLNTYPYKYVHAKKNKSGRMPSVLALKGNRTVIFSPRYHYWAAYGSDGKLVKYGRASGGKNYCPDLRRGCRTPVGVFRIYSKGGPGCKSSKFPIGEGGAPMPYCMFFRGGYALHGSYNVPGYNASHGCVRVTPNDARWLSQNFVTYGTTLIVRSY